MKKEDKKIIRKKITIKDIGIEKLLLIIGAGVLLIICSFAENDTLDTNDIKKNTNNSLDETYNYNNDYLTMLEGKLENILEKIEGVGNTYVMIKLEASAQKVVLIENPYSKSEVEETDSQGGIRKTYDIEQDYSVVLVDENDIMKPYVLKEIEPTIEGVAIVAQGANSQKVRDNIINTISSLLGISAGKISVSKMK